LKEEIEVLKSILNFCEAKSYKQIRLIGKSLGGIVSSYFLRELPKKEHGRYSVVILGYITGHVDLKDFRGKITIIQGGKDKFGNIEVVKKDLRGAESKDISFFEIPNADHSYRDPKTKDPKYENRVVELLFH
ncbi:MAG: alpha/beta family hydrolase, partial [Microgenomates group bacterium]